MLSRVAAPHVPGGGALALAAIGIAFFLGWCALRTPSAGGVQTVSSAPAAPKAEAASAALAAQKAADDGVARSRASAVAMSAAMPSDRRLRWIRQCVQKLGCKQWQVDAIIEGAPVAERPKALRVSMAAASEDVARQAKDGETLSVAQAGVIAGIVARPEMGLPMLDEMSVATVTEAKKDAEGARGKVLRVGGRIVEIRKTGELFEGALATDGGTIVHFVTSMSTAKLFEDTTATFRGVFLQEYDYANVSGGQTRSLLAVGAFEIPENRPAPTPAPASAPAAPAAPEPNLDRLRSCCGQLHKQADLEPLSDLLSVAAQCDGLAAQAGPDGRVPEKGILRTALAGRNVPPACAGF